MSSAASHDQPSQADVWSVPGWPERVWSLNLQVEVGAALGVSWDGSGPQIFP